MKWSAHLLFALALFISGCEASVGAGGKIDIISRYCLKCGFSHPQTESCPLQIPEPPKIRPHREIR